MRRIAAFVLAVMAVPVGAARAAGPVPSVGTLRAPANALAVGPDGSLWHTSAGKAPRIGRTTLAGRTDELRLPDGAQPAAIITGPDRALWFADQRGSIGRLRLDAALDTVTRTPGSPQDLALGPGGAVWITLARDDKKAPGAIARLTPNGKLETFAAGLTGSPRAITPGWDGAMWFTEPGADRVGRITADGRVEEFAAAGGPTGIVAGWDGAMWFTAREGAIGRITLTGAIGETSLGLERDAQPGELTRGPDGALWFTLKHGLGRVTSFGTITTLDTPGMRPGDLVFAPDSALWFTDATHPSLGRLGSLGATVVTPPRIGETVVAGRKNGRVRVKVPGGNGFAPLPSRASVPVGSVVDATHGKVVVTSALDDGGRTQRGTFSGGRFRVLQSANAGVVRIRLTGRLSCGGPRGTIATAPHRKHRRRRRHVWGTDSGGLFQTLGLDSVTTVRGTRWLTEDRCDGTLTRVVRGSVVVRDRHTGRRFVLHAGDRRLVRHRP